MQYFVTIDIFSDYMVAILLCVIDRLMNIAEVFDLVGSCIEGKRD